MSGITKLQPEEVWFYFDEITKIPRPSKKEEKIIAYLQQFSKTHNLVCKTDKAGNVLIKKPATIGLEHLPTVILQSHTDMVCEKNNDKIFNFETDAIETVIVDGWVKANGTTLGGDDGIGIAASLAILASKTIAHGALEALFTSDEETGLTGAFALEPGFLSGDVLINLDSEEWGEFCIGCAGGIDTVAQFKYVKEQVEADMFAVEISVKGLKGGHSGSEIHEGLGNAVKILNRFLWEESRKYNLRIANINAGNLRNAIAREAVATVVVPSNEKETIRVNLNLFIAKMESELLAIEPDMNIDLCSTEMPLHVIDLETQFSLLNSVYACPHGVIAMSHSIKGLVETSTNLASIKFKESEIIEVWTSQRSAVASSKQNIAQMVESLFMLASATTRHSDGYPGWKPNVDSAVLKTAIHSYEKIFGTKPLVKAIHAGLECGLFVEKYPHLDMVSIGPTINGAHSPDERMNIETVANFWQLLLDILVNVKR